MSEPVGFLASLLGWRPTLPSAAPTLAPLPTEYPSDADAAFARQNEFGYGTGLEPYISGDRARLVGSPRGDTSAVANFIESIPVMDVREQEKKNYISDAMTKAALVANRSPITSVGFDPSKMGLETSGAKTTLGGVYWPRRDVAFATTSSNENIVHEATHRGLEKLRKSGALSEEEQKWLSNSDMEEYLIRYLMQKYAGIKPPPKEENLSKGEIGKAQHRTAAYLFDETFRRGDNQKMLAAIERKAQDFIAAQRPRGPR